MPDKPLQEADQEIYDLIQKEKERQFEGLEMIASENFTSRAVMEALGSCLTNKYSEGRPGARYYAGNEFIDEIENLCASRALQAFKLSKEEWDVNVQPLSGSPANFEVYTSLLNPGDRIMGLALFHGGHLTHGHQFVDKDGNLKKISATSVFFESKPYLVNEETGLLDYESISKQAEEFKPHILVVGASGYPRDFDYKRFREIADSVGAILMCDMAHYSGLIVCGLMNNPFEFCDVVTSTTHKSLRGPRSGVIFSRKQFTERINFGVFPMLQGGPHNHQIAALAVQLKEVQSEEFHEYSRQVLKNSVALAEFLMAKGE